MTTNGAFSPEFEKVLENFKKDIIAACKANMAEIAQRILATYSMKKRRLSPFAEKVFSVVRTIPAGQTMTYKEVAMAAGNPGAARAVGNILNTNYDPAIPCHRVVRSDGKTGGYNRGKVAKEEILKREGAL